MMHLTVVLLVLYTQLILTYTQADGLNATPESKCNRWPGFNYESVGDLGLCLHWSDHYDTFQDARRDCKAKDARMVVAKDNDLLTMLLKKSIEGQKSIWIGLDDLSREGHFMWHDGTPFPKEDYRKYWLEGGPDNAWGKQHCVVLRSDLYQLDDDVCGKYWYYVCEKVIQ